MAHAYVPVRLHAAAPHTKRLFSGGRSPPKPSREVRVSLYQIGAAIPPREGCALPNPPVGGGMGEPGYPMVTSAVHAAAPHNAAMNISLFLGGLRPPKPSQGAGPGCASLRPASAEVWGNPVSPHPSSRAYFHVRIRP